MPAEEGACTVGQWCVVQEERGRKAKCIRMRIQDGRRLLNELLPLKRRKLPLASEEAKAPSKELAKAEKPHFL
jgi:hypothetical protein